jgi:hypothetical protein
MNTGNNMLAYRGSRIPRGRAGKRDQQPQQYVHAVGGRKPPENAHQRERRDNQHGELPEVVASRHDALPDPLKWGSELMATEVLRVEGCRKTKASKGCVRAEGREAGRDQTEPQRAGLQGVSRPQGRDET